MEPIRHQIAEGTKTKGVHTLSNFDMTMAQARYLDHKIQEHIALRQEIIKRNLFRMRDIVTMRALEKEQARIEQAVYDHWYHFQELVQALQQYKTNEITITNLITTSGRTREAERLCGVETYTGIINYGALGTSDTAPTNADTQLGAEVFRKVVASALNVNNIAYIDFYFTKADCNGTYEEFGTFIDGTASANSGKIYTHALTGGWVKLATESMIAAAQYTKS